MDCPNNLRVCPHNWSDCELCANYAACIAGTYVPEPEPIADPPAQTDPDILAQAAEISQRVVQAQAVKSANEIKGTWTERYLALSPEEGLEEFYKFKTPDIHSKEPIPAGNGLPGGGSRSGRRKKSNKGTKIPIEPWTSIT